VPPRRRPRIPVLLLGLFTATVSAAELTVSAAASLGDAFTEIAEHFEAAHPEHEVRLNLGGSGALLQQIRAGAPVDVFAAADGETMDRAAAEGLIEARQRHDIARNTLVLAVPADADAMPTGLAALAGPHIRRIAIGQPDAVPAGRYARDALQAAHLWEALAPRLVPAQNVRQALDYLARGEVDAAFVYATDLALPSRGVKRAFDVPLEAPIRYPIAPVAESREPEVARAFVGFVRSADGQAVLRRHGFLAP
jgi:molybdate transport system substrate-binding protein